MQYKDLGLYIKNKRNELNISLNQFAFTNDIDPAILSRIENLKQGVKINILEKIARGFNKTPAEFLSDFEKEVYMLTTWDFSPKLKKESCELIRQNYKGFRCWYSEKIEKLPDVENIQQYFNLLFRKD